MRDAVVSGVTALVVVGVVVGLTALLLGPALSSEASSGADGGPALGGGDVLRLAISLVGLAAGGGLGLEATVTSLGGSAQFAGHLGVVPLTLTLLLVVGFAAASRFRRATSARSHWLGAALTGVATGVLLAVLAAAARVTQLPLGEEVDPDLFSTTFALSAGLGPWRLLLTSTLLVTAASGLPRALTAARTSGSRVAPWGRALSTVLRTTAALVVAGSAAVVVLVAVDDGGSLGAAGWLAVLALLPNLALLGSWLAAGSVVTWTVDAGDLGAELLGAGGVSVGSTEPQAESYGLLAGDVSATSAVAAVALVVVVAAASLRSALLLDPRLRDPGRWWRTAAVAAAVALVVTGATWASADLVLEQVQSATATADQSYSARASGGLSIWTALLSGLVIGAFTGVAGGATRRAASLLPRLVGLADLLPGRVHPGWALLLVDATARLGHEPTARLRASAQTAMASAEGLDPLAVDRGSSRLAAAGLGVLVVAGVAVPVAGFLVAQAFYGPDAAVRDYAAALRSGDATALREAAGAEESPTLTDAALAAQREAGAVTDVRAGDVEGSGDSRTADVTFSVDGEEYSEPLQLTPSGERAFGLFERWQVDAPLPTLQVQVPGAATGLVVNGQPVDDPDGVLDVFPGAVTVTVEVDGPLEVQPWSGVVDVPTAATVVALPSVTLTDDARTQATAAFYAYLDRCEASRRLVEPGCPLWVAYPPGTAQGAATWTYQALTGVQVDLAQDGSVSASSTVSGSVAYTYQYSFFGGAASTYPTTASGRSNLYGTVTFSGGSAVFTPADGAPGT